MMFKFNCPTCDDIKRYIMIEKPKIMFCDKCGTKMTFVSEEVTVPKIIETPKPIIDASKLLPESGRLIPKANQNPECNAQGKVCSVFDGKDVCCRPLREDSEVFEVDSSEFFEIKKYALKPCKSDVPEEIFEEYPIEESE
jgi:hypothetical protein